MPLELYLSLGGRVWELAFHSLAEMGAPVTVQLGPAVRSVNGIQ